MQGVGVVAGNGVSGDQPALILAAIDWSRIGSGEAWIELLGRLHPVVVHFPIALILVAAMLEAGAMARRRLTRSRTDGETAAPPLGPTARACLLIGIAGALGSIASGWTLASDASAWGAERTTVEVHRWTAVGATALAGLAALLPVFRRGRVARLCLFAAAGLVGLAGHLGGSLVHGSGHLLEPFKAPPTDESGVTVSVAISTEAAEIFAARCVECHGPTRKRGNLRLDDGASIARRGIVDPGDPDASELIRRVLLPVEDDEAMPPEGDPRLSEPQIATLRAWIETASVAASDGVLAPTANEASDPGGVSLAPAQHEAHRAAVARLIGMGVPVAPLSAGSHGVAVHLNLATDGATDETLASLRGLERSLVVLDLSGTNVTDTAGRVIAEMASLETLHLARTGTGDGLLAAIAGLPRLRTLNLFGTNATDRAIDALAAMPALETVYLDETSVTPAAADELRARAPNITVVLGQD